MLIGRKQTIEQTRVSWSIEAKLQSWVSGDVGGEKGVAYPQTSSHSLSPVSTGPRSSGPRCLPCNTPGRTLPCCAVWGRGGGGGRLGHCWQCLASCYTLLSGTTAVGTSCLLDGLEMCWISSPKCYVISSLHMLLLLLKIITTKKKYNVVSFY